MILLDREKQDPRLLLKESGICVSQFMRYAQALSHKSNRITIELLNNRTEAQSIAPSTSELPISHKFGIV